MSIFWSDQSWQYALGSLFVEIVFCLALILLVRLLFGRWLGPTGCRLLWCVLIVRCLVPVSIPSLHHPVTHLLNAYEHRQERRLSEIGAATVMERSFNDVIGNESDAAFVVSELMEMNVAGQNGGGHGVTALPGNASIVDVEIAAIMGVIDVPVIDVEPQEDRAISPGPPQTDAVEIHVAEIGAATVMERSFDDDIGNESDAAFVVGEPMEMNVEGQNVGGFGEVALPDNVMAATAAKRINIGMILFGVWAVGVVLFLAMAILRNRSMVRAACQSPETVPDWMQAMFLECRKQLKIRTWPVLIVSRNVKTPCLVGAIRPRVLVPQQLLDEENFLRTLPPSQPGVQSIIDPAMAMRHIFLHELTHLKQGDIWLSWCWTLVMALHWYNPLLWWVGRLVGFDCEAACDHRVLEQLEPGRHASYGRSLLEILQKLNSPVVRSPGFSAVIEGKTNFERRLVMITNYRKRTYKQTLAAGVTLTLLLVASLTTFAREKHEPIPADKAKMIGYVEDFFMNNYRDVTMRNSLEWGDVVTDEKGNSTIRYKFEALIWDKERMIDCADFTFDKDGRYVSAEKVDGYPQEKEKPDTSTVEGMKKLVEKFFSQNYRDITKRKTLEWGEPQTLENGNRSIRYKYEAVIWDKDVITQEKIFTFTKDGEYVSVEDVTKEEDEPKADVSPEAVEESQKLAQEGWRFFMQGNAVEAEKKFEVAITSNPNNANAYQGLGWAQMNGGKQDEAKKTFEQCLVLDPKNSAALNGLGRIAYFNEDDEEAAIGHWEKAISFDKQATGPMMGLAQLYTNHGNDENAARYYKMWLKCEPQSEEAKKGLQEALAKLNSVASPTADEEDRQTYERLLGLQEQLRRFKEAKIRLESDSTEYELIKGELIGKGLDEINKKDISDEEKRQQQTELLSRGSRLKQEINRVDTEIKTIENELEHHKAVAQLKRDFGPGSGSRRQNEPVPAPQSPTPAKKSDADREKAAEDFLDFVYTEKYDEAGKMMTSLMQNAMPTEKLQQLFEGLRSTLGERDAEAGKKVTRRAEEQGFRVIYIEAKYEKATVTMKIAVDDDAKIAGFYIIGVLPRFGETSTLQTKEARIYMGEFSGSSNSRQFIINILFLAELKNSEEYVKFDNDNRSKVRDAVLVELRSAQDFDNMEALKNKIKSKVNEIIGKPLISEVEFLEPTIISPLKDDDKKSETPEKSIKTIPSSDSDNADAEQYAWDKFGIRGRAATLEEVQKQTEESERHFDFVGAVHVEEISPDSIFGNMKLQKDDLLAGMISNKNAWNITQMSDLNYLAERWTPEELGEEVTVIVIRNGEQYLGKVPVTKFR